MTDERAPVVFDQERASSYDKRFAKLAPMKDTLHLLTQLVLADLPADARVLCVGVGTGAELLHLAQAFPGWRFAAVEPAAPMLDICRAHAEEAGIASRCTFHEGYLETLPEAEPFDAATSVLVSHFLVDPDERRGFFRGIAERLRPDAYLVSADLASEMSSPLFERLLEVWVRGLEYAEMPAEKVAELRSSFGTRVALLPPREIEAMLASSGFGPATLFYQSVLIHAWFARRSI